MLLNKTNIFSVVVYSPNGRKMNRSTMSEVETWFQLEEKIKKVKAFGSRMQCEQNLFDG